MSKNNCFEVCKSCSDKKRNDFQKTDYVSLLKEIQLILEKERLSKKSAQHYVAKIPFQSLEIFFNEEINTNFYYNTYDIENPNCEHMWIDIGDVYFDKNTICGILRNEPVHIPVNYGSIIIADFSQIEDIQEYN